MNFFLSFDQLYLLKEKKDIFIILNYNNYQKD